MPAKEFTLAAERFESLGVDVEKAIEKAASIPVSMHCWQGDDVAGFEGAGSLDGGLAVTGNYPGAARNGDELRQDIAEAFTLIPGAKRLNLHAIYAETGGVKVERDELTVEHFARWLDFAVEQDIALDFNPSYFAHPMASEGLTLSHPDSAVRKFWVRHGVACRKIGEGFGRRLGKCCVTNFWMPDGYKDTPADRLSPRCRMADSLDEIFSARIAGKYNRDAVESKLFGIGSESYVVGSHEFFMGYAMRNDKLLCLDAGHFHPTEVISDKISSTLLFLDEVLLHVSRGVRWDSDHVIAYNEELCSIASEVFRGKFEDRVHIALDYFDASINRIAAWVIGMRNMQKALLHAALEPSALLKKYEKAGDYTARMLLTEEVKTLPFGAVWDEYCRRADVVDGAGLLECIRDYEKKVLSKRK